MPAKPRCYGFSPGEIEKSGGEYEFGHNTTVGYYAQHHADSLDKTQNVYDSVRSVAKEATHQQIRGALGAMLFGDLEIEKIVGVLSGGERARVALAQLLVAPGNVLLMDEPTNHLDLESSERLAEAMDSFDGTLLFVSHNRAFIRRLAKTIWFVEDGKVIVYPGSLDDYMEKCRLEGLDPAAASVSDAEAAKRHAPGTSSGSAKKGKNGKSGQKNGKKNGKPSMGAKSGSKSDGAKPKETKAQRAERRAKTKKLRPLERRCGELEKRIAKLEAEQEERTQQLSDPAVVSDDAKRSDITKAYERAQVELEVAMDTWTEVQEELETLKAELEA